MGLLANKLELPTAEVALPGRTEKMPVPESHFVNGNSMTPPYPTGAETAMFGLGCFWGAEIYQRGDVQIVV